MGVLEHLLRNALIRRRHDLGEHRRGFVQPLGGFLVSASSGVSARAAVKMNLILFTSRVAVARSAPNRLNRLTPTCAANRGRPGAGRRARFNDMWSDDRMWSSCFPAQTYKLGRSGLLERFSPDAAGAAPTAFNSSSSWITFAHSTLSLLVETGALRSP